MIYSLKPFSRVQQRPRCCEWLCSSSSWSKPRVLKCLWKSLVHYNPSPSNDQVRVFCGQNADCCISHWICFWSCKGNICNSLLSCKQSVPNIWQGNVFGPIMHVAVELQWRKKGDICMEGATGTDPPWSAPYSHVGEERGGLQGWCLLVSWTWLLEETPLFCALPMIQQPYFY